MMIVQVCMSIYMSACSVQEPKSGRCTVAWNPQSAAVCGMLNELYLGCKSGAEKQWHCAETEKESPVSYLAQRWSELDGGQRGRMRDLSRVNCEGGSAFSPLD